MIRDIIICEFIPHKHGSAISITAAEAWGSKDHDFKFNNLGEDGKLANFIIQDMIEGHNVKKMQ